MNTAERIAWGLLSFIVLIGWLRWRGTPRGSKEGGASPSAEKGEEGREAKRVDQSATSY
jgi:hypothetical protein